MINRAIGTTALTSVFILGAASAGAEPPPYVWETVAIGGGGYVTGLVIHPSDPDAIYIRTDVGGAYRFDPRPGDPGWRPLMDHFDRPMRNFRGIQSLAVDPTDPQVVYAAAGAYPKSTLVSWNLYEPTDVEHPTDVLKSVDGGQSWTATELNLDIAGNTGGRWTGERLAVDPNNADVVYFGSQSDGLWRSPAAAEPGSWQRVDSFPTAGADGAGIRFVLIDPDSGAPGDLSQTLYAGVVGEGVFRSTDAGTSWTRLAGSPTNASRAALAQDGSLYVTHADGVARLNGTTWTDISPAGGEFNAITVDPSNPDRVIAAQRVSGFNNSIYLSTDRGQQWREINQSNIVQQGDVPWWPEQWFGSSIASVTFDPHAPGRVWMTDWYGIWRTEDISADTPVWTTHQRGHEETVTFDLLSPPARAPLFSGLADVDGFRHAELDTYPDRRFSSFQDTTSLDYAGQDPDMIVRVGQRRWNNTGGGMISHDNGQTWAAFPNLPHSDSRGGRVAISADGDAIVWAPHNQAVYFSHDQGQSWQQAQGLPGAAVMNHEWKVNQPLAADRIDGDRFYIYKAGRLYRSDDRGANWSGRATLPNVDWTWQEQVEAAPGITGEVWVSLGYEGLWRSSDAGDSFAQLANVERSIAFSFGASAPGRDNPSVFVYGVIDDELGVFLSDDFGQEWHKVSIPEVGLADAAVIAGDMQTYGRVYVGDSGRGVWVGEPIPEPGTLGLLGLGGLLLLRRTARARFSHRTVTARAMTAQADRPDSEAVR